jgi:hypothetical protein
VHAALSGDLGKDRSRQPDGLAATHLLDLSGSEMHEREMGDRRIGRQQRRPRILHGLELVEGDR